ncbi:F0F1 ATP synthase subunit B [Candidatus Saccharibacteria bacterium]|nr:F0F1 ATP synthase subunit B [Candidatus Saccharibacteria bacterium]
MLNSVTYFASEAASAEASGGLFESLGINLQMLIFQMIAFVVLVLLLGKFVFPVLMKAVDDRQAKIEMAGKAAEAAEKKAEAAESKIEDVLKKARTEAADIVATAKNEATQMIEKAEANAKSRSERIVTEAHEELSKDVLAARKTLEKDVISLVKQAASIAVSGVADSKLDDALIKKSVQEAKK